MRKKDSKHRVRGLAVFLVLIAITFAGYQSYKDMRTKPTQNTRESDSVFRDTSWMYKANFVLGFNPTSNLQEISNTLSKYQQEAPVYSLESGNNGAFIIKVANSRVPELKSELASLGSISRSQSTTDSTLISTSPEIERQKLESYQTERSTLDAIRVRSEVENRRMDTLNRLISQTIDRLERLQSSDTTLVYLVVSPATRNLKMLSIAKQFLRDFIVALVVLLIASALVYFGTRLLMTLLAMLGIKGFGLENVFQNYSYKSYGNYAGKYSYGYGNKKNRKVKRVYKEKAESSGEENSDDSGK